MGEGSRKKAARGREQQEERGDERQRDQNVGGRGEKRFE
jgi:hypothetical protein